MNRLSLKSRLIVNTLVILTLALGFNAMLTLNSLEKFYVESIASQYSVVGKDLKRNIERSLGFGKSIENFVGMDKILEDTKSNLIKKNVRNEASIHLSTSTADDVSVSMALPDGRILSSTRPDLVGTRPAVHARIDYKNAPDQASPAYIKYKDTYVTHISIRDAKDEWVATAMIMFNQDQVKSVLKKVRNQSIALISAILCGGVAVLALMFHFMLPDKSGSPGMNGNSSKLKLQVMVFLVVGLAQIVFSGINTYSFKTYYLEINRQKAGSLIHLLKEDIEFLLNKNIRIHKLVRIDAELNKIITGSPELREIAILDADGTPLYRALNPEAGDPNAGNPDAGAGLKGEDPYTIRVELMQEGRIEGYISTRIFKKALFKKLLETGLDSATIIVISILFFGELLVLAFQFINRQARASSARRIHYKSIRPIAFLFLFCIDISISFLPLHMEALYEPVFGFSKAMVMGLPISVEMFASGLAILWAGVWMDRRGWYEPFFWGLVLSSIGLLYSWAAPNALQFILSRGMVGAGYGLSLMAVQGFVIVHSDEKNQAQGLAQLFAGVYAGSICGAAMGAMLAERIGYRIVFFIAAVILVLLILGILVLMEASFKRQKPMAGSHDGPAGPAQIRAFFFNRSILGLLLFGIIPSATAVVGFVNYFFPVYLDRIGTSQSNIGRVYMVFGLCLIYIAPVIGRIMDASGSRKKYLVMGGVLGSLALILYYFFDGLAVTAGAIFLLGLSMCFDASRPYALTFRETRNLGIGKSLSIFTSFEKIGQIIGPVLFGVLFMAKDLHLALAYFGIGYLALTLIFFLTAQKDSPSSLDAP
ncbi:MAG: MFS transporter [Desulfobacteraceae bacterium]|nr:MFS transporter [Desulfobacteraceae bacterium]